MLRVARRTRRTTSGRDVRAVVLDTNQLLLDLREELRARKPVRKTLTELAEKFLPVKMRTLASASDFDGRMRNHILPALGARTSETLRKRDVQAFLLDLVGGGLSPQTANHVRDVGRQLVEDAIDNDEWEGSNPFARVVPFQIPEKEKDVFSRGEAKALLRAVPWRWRPLFALALYLGPRRKTIYSLRLDDVDLVHGLIDFNDTKTRRRIKKVPIPRGLTPYLKRAVADSKGEFLFTNRNGTRHARDSKALARVLRAAMRKAGIRRQGDRLPGITFRGLRRVCSCLLQEAGCSPWVVSRVLGHSQSSLAAMGNPVENVTARAYTVFSPGFVRRQLNKLEL